jgi:hypothetical protein
LKATLSLMLVVSLVLSAVPVSAEPSLRPVSSALQREATRLALDPEVTNFSAEEREQSRPDWSRVRRLGSGTRLSVTVKGQRSRHLRFVAADEFQLVVREPTGAQQAISRSDVAQIGTFKPRNSATGAVGGAVLGVRAGSRIALNLGFNSRCQPSCGGVEALMLLSAIGIPVAGGLLGYHAFARSVEVVIYQAP